MSLTMSLETLAAEGFTGLFLSAGQKGDGAKITKRAQTVLEIVTALTAVEQGNTVQGTTTLTAAIGSSDLDPGEALALQGLFGQIAKQAAAIVDLENNTVAGQIAATVYTNIANGVAAACNAEIAKYGGAAQTTNTKTVVTGK